MNYALIENNVVVNIIYLSPSNAKEFPGAVLLNGIPVGIGDTYDGKYFYRNGNRILTFLEKAQNTIVELDKALLEIQYQSIIGGLE